MKLETLLDGLVFGEGPRWRGDRLWLSDMHAHTVLTVDLSGKREDVLRVEGKPSGLGWLPDGRLLVVSMEDRRLLRREASGALVTHADLTALAPAACNDMVVDGAGRAYVGNFGFDFEHGEKPRTTCVVRVDPDGSASKAADELRFPNGSVITPDGRTLVVGESFGNCLTAFSIGEGRLALPTARVGEARRRHARRHLPRRGKRDLGGLAHVERGAPRARGRRGRRAHPDRPPRDRVHARRPGAPDALRAHRRQLPCGGGAREPLRPRRDHARERTGRRLPLSGPRAPCPTLPRRSLEDP